MAVRLECTLEEVIERVNRLKPNPYTSEQKTEWINKVEGMLQTDALDIPAHQIKILDWETDKETELLAKLPHSDVYDHYLFSMIDYMNSDIESYNNSMTMFNTLYNMAVKSMRKSNPAHTNFKNWW